jgi:hypothetical protein
VPMVNQPPEIGANAEGIVDERESAIARS